MSNFKYWIASFPPSPASEPIQRQFWLGPGVPKQLMTHWRVTVSGLLGPELASARLPILLLLLRRRNHRRKWGIGHLESRSTIWLSTHLLLQLLWKVSWEGSISANPTGRHNLNLSLCWVLFLSWPIIQDPVGYLFRLLCEGSWDKWLRSQRVRITRVSMRQNMSPQSASLKVRVEQKVHPTCQKLWAPRMLVPIQGF
jgi:hypothetical protein